MKMRIWLLLLATSAFLWACEVTITESDGGPTTTEDAGPTDVATTPAFCEDYVAICGDWAGDADCATWWAAAEEGTEGDTSGASQGCYNYHLDVAASSTEQADIDAHCAHSTGGADADGNAPCVAAEATACDTFCADQEINCAEDNAIDWGDSDCLTVCASWSTNADFHPGDGGDSVECRQYHVGAAADDPAVHCPHASVDGGGVCVDELNYYAVFIEDIFDGKCGTSGAPGADIDAVELRSADGDSLGYWEYVAMSANPDGDTSCTYDTSKDTDENGVDDIYEDVEEAKGAPDGTLFENFISLYGGWAIGEFGSDANGDDLYVMDGDVVVVYEVGKANPNVGEGIDEGYSVSLATDIDCVNQDNFRETCLVAQGDQDEYAEVVISLDGM